MIGMAPASAASCARCRPPASTPQQMLPRAPSAELTGPYAFLSTSLMHVPSRPNLLKGRCSRNVTPRRSVLIAASMPPASGRGPCLPERAAEHLYIHILEVHVHARLRRLEDAALDEHRHASDDPLVTDGRDILPLDRERRRLPLDLHQKPPVHRSTRSPAQAIELGPRRQPGDDHLLISQPRYLIAVVFGCVRQRDERVRTIERFLGERGAAGAELKKDAGDRARVGHGDRDIRRERATAALL
eukprot:4291681-Prymnesium_polylepis.1